MVSPGWPAGPVLTGGVDIVLMTVLKCTKNVPKNVPITLRRERYTSLKKHLANVPNTLRRGRCTRFCVCANYGNMVMFEVDLFLV